MKLILLFFHGCSLFRHSHKQFSLNTLMLAVRGATTILRRSSALCSSHAYTFSVFPAVSMQRRFLLQATPILHELKMSKRRQRPKHSPSLGFSVPVAIIAVLFTIFMIISIKSGSFETAVNSKRTFF
ncbi:membrane-associated protein, putative [Bodo saltans]|uniref:Membrane-associated protein, putative n=1 Tax=Bodo saltans TaxID=75058 RepID=A0A0S4KLF3_BODSA|nr:membrane-associated protein, putative [Bodo saltans]|eukprot:CUI15452.1 membrane-associated protein, putative [Bodo saltans]